MLSNQQNKRNQPIILEKMQTKKSYAWVLKSSEVSSDYNLETLSNVPITRTIKTKFTQTIKSQFNNHLDLSIEKLSKAIPWESSIRLSDIHRDEYPGKYDGRPNIILQLSQKSDDRQIFLA